MGDEEAYSEVEVTLPDGRQVDVALDRTFTVTGVEATATSRATGNCDSPLGVRSAARTRTDAAVSCCCQLLLSAAPESGYLAREAR